MGPSREVHASHAVSFNILFDHLERISDDGKYSVGQSASHRFLLLKRSSTPFETVSEVEQSIEGAAKHFPYIRNYWKLLIDLRDGPMRTDPAFERVIRRTIPNVVRNFEARAILVNSAVGVLQVSRHTSEQSTNMFVTKSESEALRHLGYAAAFTDRPTPDVTGNNAE